MIDDDDDDDDVDDLKFKGLPGCLHLYKGITSSSTSDWQTGIYKRP